MLNVVILSVEVMFIVEGIYFLVKFMISIWSLGMFINVNKFMVKIVIVFVILNDVVNDKIIKIIVWIRNI